MKLPEKNKAAQLLEQYCEAYKRRDLPIILSLFTKDCNIWGTAIDEYRTGLKELEIQHQRDWCQSDRGVIQIISWVPVPLEAQFAAAICKAIITIEGKENIFEHLRGTVTIKKEEGVWKIAHMHASFPDFRNAENASFPNVT